MTVAAGTPGPCVCFKLADAAIGPPDVCHGVLGMPRDINTDGSESTLLSIYENVTISSCQSIIRACGGGRLRVRGSYYCGRVTRLASGLSQLRELSRA
eukprot:759045-Hanusia_phi.AAC.2